MPRARSMRALKGPRNTARVASDVMCMQSCRGRKARRVGVAVRAVAHATHKRVGGCKSTKANRSWAWVRMMVMLHSILEMPRSENMTWHAGLARCINARWASTFPTCGEAATKPAAVVAPMRKRRRSPKGQYMHPSSTRTRRSCTAPPASISPTDRKPVTRCTEQGICCSTRSGWLREEPPMAATVALSTPVKARIAAWSGNYW